MEADHQYICRYDRKHFYTLTITNMTAKQILQIQMCKLCANLKYLHGFYIDMLCPMGTKIKIHCK